MAIGENVVNLYSGHTRISSSSVICRLCRFITLFLLYPASSSYSFPNPIIQPSPSQALALLKTGMLIFQNFISRYENFKSRDSSSTRNKLGTHAWTMHLMHECCNTVDIIPCSCGWVAAPGKWSEGQEAVAVSNYKARLSLSCTRVTDRLPSSQTHHTLWL